MGGSDFITKFYNLEGDLISERKKNFSKLLKAQSVPLNEADLKDLHPRTYLEKLFQIDIFTHFNLSSKLLDVIKDGNATLISRVLKHPLILKAAIGDISPEKFVNDFLPCTSYALRMKILKKMSFCLEESQMDEIIFWVHKRYGFNVAIKLLHTCSSDQIKKFLYNYEVKLKPRQIKFIFDKDTELLVAYLNHRKNLSGDVFQHRNLCKYIAQKNPELWLKLQREHIITSVNIGRRASKHIIRLNHDEVLNNIEYYSIFLKLHVIVRELHGNFKDVYFNFFPRDISNLSTDGFSFKLLRYYPKKKQWDLFENTFARVFQRKVIDSLIDFDYSFLKMFPNTAYKHKWAEMHYESDKSTQEQMLKYYPPDKAIPLIKEKIDVTASVDTRIDLVTLLVKNCGENKDLVSLEGVLQYIWVRHRNEDILLPILREVSRCFELKQFNENHWNYLNKIIALLRLKNSLRNSHANFVLKYIEFLFLHGKPFRKELLTFLRDVRSNCFFFNINVNYPELKKQIFIEILNTYTDENDFSSNPYDNFTEESLMTNIIDFNTQNREHMIDLSLFPRVITYIESLLDKSHKEMPNEETDLLQTVIIWNLKFPENPNVPIKKSQVLKIIQENKFTSHFEKSIIKMITKHNRSDFEDEVLQLFLGGSFMHSYEIRLQVISWLLTNEPKTIISYIDNGFTLGSYGADLSKVKLLSHLGLDKRVISICTNTLDEFVKKTLELKSTEGVDASLTKADKLRIDKGIIAALAVLLPTNEYVDMVERRFIPISSKIETADGSFNKLYALQCQIVRSLKETQEPIKTLPTLIKFCLGDYLRSALPSLYSICYTTPEKMLYSHIDTLSKGSVSVRKHALFLSCELLNFDFAVNMLQSSNESNASAQKHVISATLKYFQKNPCEKLLNMVVNNLNKIDKNDLETFNNLTTIKMPKKYTDFYIQKCWYFLEAMGKDVYIQTYLESFLRSIISSEDIIMSSPDLCNHIIIRYFKEPPGKEEGKNKELQSIYTFVSTVLRYQKSETTYDFIFEIISEFKKNHRIKRIKNLFDQFYGIALEDIKCNNKIDTDNNYHIELFKQHWFNTFTPDEMFDECFLINLLYIKCRSYHKMENYVKDVVVYLEELVGEYGLHIYNKFKNLMAKHSYAPKDKYNFFYNMLKYKNSALNCILILDLLEQPSNNYTNWTYNNDDVEQEEDLHDEIIQMLNTCNDPVVSVYLNGYINSK